MVMVVMVVMMSLGLRLYIHSLTEDPAEGDQNVADECVVNRVHIDGVKLLVQNNRRPNGQG